MGHADIIGVLEGEPSTYETDAKRAAATASWHIRGVGPTDHNTLCGLDANDPAIGHYGTVPAKRGQQVTCGTCYTIWRGLRTLRIRLSNFTREAKSQ